MSKKQSVQEYIPPHTVHMEGATSPEGIAWIKLSAPRSGIQVWIERADFSDDAAAAKKRMRANKLVLFGEDLKTCIDEARRLSSFPPLPLIQRSGWTGLHFALPSGEVFSPPGEPPATVLFDANPNKCRSKGTVEWKKEVARLAAGQYVITFGLMIAFAAPILSLSRVLYNPGFELGGAKGTGKSTLQQLVASVVGGAVEPAGNNYWFSANTTVNGLEELMPEHNDLPMIVEEMSLFAGAEKNRNRAQKLNELVFRLANGSMKIRYQVRQQPPARFVYLTSTNEPIAELLGTHQSRTSEAAGDRLLTIPISAKRKHGIFDKLPKGCRTGEDGARAISSLIADHHGKPMRVYLRRLVEARATDEVKLKEQIEGYIQQFRDAVGIDGNVGSEARVADAVGVVYAASKLAQAYGALPRELNCLKAAVKVHELNRNLSGRQASNIERLKLLSSRRGVLHIDTKELSDISDDELDVAPALLRKTRSGDLELMLTPKMLKRNFPFKRALFKDPEIHAIVCGGSGKHLTAKRTIRTNKRQERFYVFALPLENE